MGQDDNSWLSFSRPQEVLRSSTYSQHQQPHQILQSSYANSGEQYCFDNLYAPNYAGWSNSKGQVMFTGGGNHQGEVKEAVTESFFTSFETSPAPKLEDFLGGDPETTQEDSSLTHNFDHSDLTAFQAFSANSGSEEVDDSAQREYVGQSIESAKELVAAYSQECPYGGVLTLGVNHGSSTNTTNRNPVNAIVPVDSGGSKKIIADTFGQRTSIYRGVTRHRWTGRYEAHLWDNSCRREGQARKGRQVYLGGYDKEDNAARAYDLAALKYWGPTATINFPVTTYTKELEEMKNVAKQEFIASLRRKSSGFSRGASIYRGVTRHHQQGRWQARIGRVAGNKDLYLGTFATEEEAAEAYDIAAIKFRGLNAVTNFEMNRYDVEAITKSSLPIAGATKRLKLSLEAEEKPSLSSNPYQQSNSNNGESSIDFAAAQPVSAIPFGVPFDSTTPFCHHSLFHHLCSGNAGTSDTSGSVTSAETPVPPPAGFFVWPRQSY